LATLRRGQEEDVVDVGRKAINVDAKLSCPDETERIKTLTYRMAGQEMVAGLVIEKTYRNGTKNNLNQ
jgi:hypothetical protein